MKATVVHYKRDEYDVYIGRGPNSKWGNPFRIGKDGSRLIVIQKYREWMLKQPNLLYDLQELRGMRLGCWCSPAICHGDVLAELANIPTGPAIWKNEEIDIIGIAGSDLTGTVLLKTIYGDTVPVNELTWI